jgi:uncharacterized protein (UPF0305 family)
MTCPLSRDNPEHRVLLCCPLFGKDDWNAKIAEIGDYAELVRELRNFAHPARYLEDHYRKRVTQKHLEYVIEIINDVADWLYARIARSLMERMKEEEAASTAVSPYRHWR